MIVAGVFSDLHLSTHIWASKPGLRGDSYFALQQLVDFAVEEDVPLIGAGDLVDDRHPSSSTVGVVRDALMRLQKAKQKLYYVQGNHEWCDPPWLSVVSHGAEHIHRQQVVDIKGFTLAGLDFMPPATMQQLAASEKELFDADILVCHQAWKELLGFSELSLSILPTVETIITGDHHEHCTFEMEAADGRMVRVYSPGSMCMQSIDEEPTKKFWVLHDDGSMTSRTLKTRKLLIPDPVESEDDLIDLLSQLGEQLDAAWDRGSDLPTDIRKPMLFIVLSGSVPAAHSKIVEAVGDRAFVFTRLESKTTEESQPGDVSPVASRSLLERVNEFAEAGPVRHMCQVLLNKQTMADAKAALQKLREEQLGEREC